MNGIPVSDILEMSIEEVVMIEYVENWPYIRKSWSWLLNKIKHPAEMNSKALNIAWTDMWKNAKFGIFMPKHVTIKPSCLNVDKAIIFFCHFHILLLFLLLK